MKKYFISFGVFLGIFITSFFVINLKAYAATLDSYDFNTTGDLTNYFTADGEALFTESASSGINSTRGISVSGVQGLYTAKTGHPTLGIGDTYTISGYFLNDGSGGYGGIGFLADATSAEQNGSGLPIGLGGLGMYFHGGGGGFVSNSTDYNAVSWDGGDLFNATWYKMVFSVTRTGTYSYDIIFQIWNSNSDGTLTTKKTERTSTITNISASNATTWYPYFLVSQTNRFKAVDNLEITDTAPTSPADTTPPTLQSISPANNAVDVATNTNIVLTFDEPVFLGTGLITLGTNGNAALVENITVDGGQVTGNGTTTITIDPPFDILEGTEVFVNIPNTAFHDASENYYPGLSAGSASRFTIIDNTAPVLTEISALTGKLPANSDGIYRFSTNELCEITVTPPTSTTGEVQALAEEVFINQPIGITLEGMKAGGTYSFNVSCIDASGNVSNTLSVGPFTVYKKPSAAAGYASSAYLSQAGIALKNTSHPNKTCPTDQILSFPVNIKKLQAHLARLGFNPGPIDGMSGPITLGAIKKYQASVHVDADGVVGPITRGLINNSCK